MAYTNKRIDNSIKRAALYARVSTEEQAMHGVSLDAQQERLVQYAKENNLSIVDIYVDEGISARKRYTRRPQFLRMLEDVKQNKIDVVLFIKLDRWFRNIADYYEVQAILDKHRVQWIATEEDYDTTTANGRLALNIKLAIAQDESDRTSERIKFVFNNMVKDGRVISGSTPLGYKIENKRVVIDEEKIHLTKFICQNFIDTRSTKQTQRDLLSKYGFYMDLKSMKRLLMNPWLKGEAYGIPGWCPAVIDERSFDLIQSALAVRSERYDGTRSDRVYLFTGLIHCGCCGRRMTTYACRNKNKDGSTRQTFIYYRCPAHIDRICDMQRQFNQEKLEEWLVENLVCMAEQYNCSLEAEKKTAPKKAIDTAKIRNKLEKLKDLYINDLIERDVYERDYRDLMLQLTMEKKEEERQSAKPIDMSKLRGFKSMYSDLSPEARKAFWSRTINKITVTPTGDLQLTFNQL